MCWRLWELPKEWGWKFSIKGVHNLDGNISRLQSDLVNITSKQRILQKMDYQKMIRQPLLTTHINEKWHTCLLFRCGKPIFRNHYYWTGHLLKRHINHNITPPYNCKAVKCEAKKFNTFQTFVLHFYNEHLEIEYICRCGKAYKLQEKDEADQHFIICDIRGSKCHSCLKVFCKCFYWTPKKFKIIRPERFFSMILKENFTSKDLNSCLKKSANVYSIIQFFTNSLW